MAVTIRDVAEAAGVSPMAVSKVLHGRGATVRVSAKKAESIRAAAASLQYQVNHLARSFRTKRTNTVALVFEEFRRLGGNTGYFVQLFDGVMGAAFDRGYSVTVCPKMVNFSENGVAYDGRFDGLIWCKPFASRTAVEALGHSDMPVVALHAPFQDHLNVPMYCANNIDGMRQAVQHLVHLGHQQITFAVDPANNGSFEAEERFDGYRRAVLGAGLSIDSVKKFEWSHTADEFADAWRNEQTGTAMIIFGEGQAGEILSRAREVGVRVPEELSVVGFDSTPFCNTTLPPLTAIHQPVEAMATAACHCLIDQIEGIAQPSAIRNLYECTLHVRGSTGAVPKK